MGTAGVPSAPAATEAGTWTNPLFAQDAEAQGSSGHDVDIFSSARSSRVYKIKSLGDIVRKLGKAVHSRRTTRSQPATDRSLPTYGAEKTRDNPLAAVDGDSVQFNPSAEGLPPSGSQASMHRERSAAGHPRRLLSMRRRDPERPSKGPPESYTIHAHATDRVINPSDGSRPLQCSLSKNFSSHSAQSSNDPASFGNSSSSSRSLLRLLRFKPRNSVVPPQAPQQAAAQLEPEQTHSPRTSAKTAPIGMYSAPDLGHATFSSEPDDPCTPKPPGIDTRILTSPESYPAGAPAPLTPMQVSTPLPPLLAQPSLRRSLGATRNTIALPTGESLRNERRTIWSRAHASGVWQGQAMVAFEQLVVEWDSLRTELEQNRPSPVASPAGSRRGRTGRPAHDAISMALDKLVQLEHSTLQMATVGGRRSFGTRGQRRPEASGVSVCSVTGGAATGILGSGFRASAILGESGVQKMPVGALDTNAQTDNLEGDLQSEERGTGAGHKGDQQQLGSPHGSGTLDWGAQVRGDLDSEDYGPVMLESGPAVPGDTVDSYRDPPRDQTNMVGQSTVITKAFRAAGIFDSGGTAPVPLRVRYDQKAQGAIDALDAPATLRVDGRPGSHIVPSSCPSVNAFSDSCQESVGEHTTLASMESQRPRQQQQQRRWQRKGPQADSALHHSPRGASAPINAQAKANQRSSSSTAQTSGKCAQSSRAPFVAPLANRPSPRSAGGTEPLTLPPSAAAPTRPASLESCRKASRAGVSGSFSGAAPECKQLASAESGHKASRAEVSAAFSGAVSVSTRPASTESHRKASRAEASGAFNGANPAVQANTPRISDAVPGSVDLSPATSGAERCRSRNHISSAVLAKAHTNRSVRGSSTSRRSSADASLTAQNSQKGRSSAGISSTATSGKAQGHRNGLLHLSPSADSKVSSTGRGRSPVDSGVEANMGAHQAQHKAVSSRTAPVPALAVAGQLDRSPQHSREGDGVSEGRVHRPQQEAAAQARRLSLDRALEAKAGSHQTQHDSRAVRSRTAQTSATPAVAQDRTPRSFEAQATWRGNSPRQEPARQVQLEKKVASRFAAGLLHSEPNVDMTDGRHSEPRAASSAMKSGPRSDSSAASRAMTRGPHSEPSITPHAAQRTPDISPRPAGARLSPSEANRTPRTVQGSPRFQAQASRSARRNAPAETVAADPSVRRQACDDPRGGTAASDAQSEFTRTSAAKRSPHSEANAASSVRRGQTMSQDSSSLDSVLNAVSRSIVREPRTSANAGQEVSLRGDRVVNDAAQSHPKSAVSGVNNYHHSEPLTAHQQAKQVPRPVRYVPPVHDASASGPHSESSAAPRQGRQAPLPVPPLHGMPSGPHSESFTASADAGHVPRPEPLVSLPLGNIADSKVGKLAAKRRTCSARCFGSAGEAQTVPIVQFASLQDTPFNEDHSGDSGRQLPQPVSDDSESTASLQQRPGRRHAARPAVPIVHPVPIRTDEPAGQRRRPRAKPHRSRLCMEAGVGLDTLDRVLAAAAPQQAAKERSAAVPDMGTDWQPLVWDELKARVRHKRSSRRHRAQPNRLAVDEHHDKSSQRYHRAGPSWVSVDGYRESTPRRHRLAVDECREGSSQRPSRADPSRLAEEEHRDGASQKNSRADRCRVSADEYRESTSQRHQRVSVDTHREHNGSRRQHRADPSRVSLEEFRGSNASRRHHRPDPSFVSMDARQEGVREGPPQRHRRSKANQMSVDERLEGMQAHVDRARKVLMHKPRQAQ